MNEQYPCRVCKIEVEENYKSIQCDLCNYWNHIDCVGESERKYEKLKTDPLPWYCPTCSKEMPFSQMNNKDLRNFLYSTNTPPPPKVITKSSEEIKSMMARFKQVNQLFDGNENSISCDYYDINELNKLSVNQKDLKIIHLNISSLPLHINELKIFLSLVKVRFDIISLSESRITKNNSLTTNIDIPGYNIEHTPTESKAGGCLLYISNKVSYKLRSDLNIYCPKQLESVFIEVLLPNQKNHIIGVIYKHPSMNVSKFTNEYFNDLLNRIRFENKNALLAGDFNVNLIN